MRLPARRIETGSEKKIDEVSLSIKHYARGGKQRSFALGERIKKLRKERVLTQENLARAAGISRMQMNRIESDVSKPGLETMMRLADALGVPLRDTV
ncbi:MAG TPA: helix-turn-helix transcriptional regulator [Nitrospira sp.]|nr:helix-turn-helix transcriptional regulator [Nitrospira sp.]